MGVTTCLLNNSYPFAHEDPILTVRSFVGNTMGDITFLRLDCSGCDVQLRIRIASAGCDVECPACEALTKSPTLEQVNRLKERDIPEPMMAENDGDLVMDAANA